MLGSGSQFSTSFKGALKITEVSSLHCEAIMSGDHKHGVLVLVDVDMPIVMILTQDDLFARSMNAYQQFIARGGHPIVLCNPGAFEPSDSCVTLGLPSTVNCLQGLLIVLPLQLMAYLWLGRARMWIVREI